MVTFALLFPAVLLLVTSLLAVFRAPTHFLWMAAVGATELGHALALLCLVAAIVLSRNSGAGRVAAAISVAAAVVSLTPVIRASLLARSIPQQLHDAFGDAVPSRSAPLIYTDLFRGVSLPQVKAEPLTYSSIGGTDLPLDFYRAQSAGPAPLIIVIHGGSWRSGDNKDFIGMNRYLAGRGFAVADIIYRLAPKWRFPAAIDDVRAAVAFLRARADGLKIDPNRIVLLGRSAGGQIALTAAYSTKDAGIRGVISIYGPTDFYWAWDHPGNPAVIDTRTNLREYVGGTPSEVSSLYDEASPIRLVTSATPPTLLLHGGRDELVSPEDSSRLNKRLTEAGIPHLYISLPWATHGFDYILRGPGGQISTYAIEYFLATITKR